MGKIVNRKKKYSVYSINIKTRTQLLHLGNYDACNYAITQFYYTASYETFI